MDGSSGGVEISKFVDDWLTAIENAVDAASNEQLTANAKLYDNKYVKDLVDALSKQLVRYIEHPDPSNQGSRIIFKRNRLMVSTDETPDNVPVKTRRGRIKFIIMEILKRKGTDDRRFEKLKDTIEKNLQIAPETLAPNAEWSTFNENKLPKGDPEELRFYYDPANVDDELRVKKIYGSRINLENIDQYRNDNLNFDKRMTNYFGKPDFRSIDRDLLNKARGSLGNYKGPQNVKVNAGDVEGMVEESLDASGFTTTPEGAEKIANAANNKTVGAVATEVRNNAERLTTGAAPTPAQANAIANKIVNGSNKNVTNTARNKTLDALKDAGLEPKSENSLNKIAKNATINEVGRGTNVAGTNMPPSTPHANLGAQAVQAAVNGAANGTRASNKNGLRGGNSTRANAFVPPPDWVTFPTNGSRASNNAGTPPGPMLLFLPRTGLLSQPTAAGLRIRKRNNTSNRTVRAQQLANSMVAEGFNRKNAKNNPFL